jgi:GDP-4-dehydro-6-deoxy-D-mannose reductase
VAKLAHGAGAVLVTGAAGFVGSWLLPELSRAGYPLIAVHRPGEAAGEHDLPELRWHSLDIREPAGVAELIASAQPAAVVHLAGIAVPAQATADPLLALETNYMAVDHLVRALDSHCPRARLLLISTGEVYGRRAAAAPAARELDPLAPSNVYAATKAAAEQRASLAAAQGGLDVVIARPFNHTGPGRPAQYAEASFARQIAQAEKNASRAGVRVGNLQPIRDWSDVRDVVHAYRVLLERAKPGEVYNTCSGRGHAVAEVLETLRGLARVPLAVQIDPARYEDVPADRLALVGNPSKLRGLGWTPRHPLAATLASLLDDWRTRI